MDTLWQMEGESVHRSSQSLISFVSYNESMGARQNEEMLCCKERRVLILYVGGTIGMTRMPSGALKPCKGYLTQVVKKMEMLQKRTDIAPFDIIEYDELLDSSEVGAKEYMRIAKDLERHYADYDGFLILHGTDTMHYTASALSFLLTNLAKPVLLTGSMVPLVEPYNDARRNFIISLTLVSNLTICEVCVFFNDRLMRGNCCGKLHHTFGAFCSFNYPALGVVDATGFRLRDHLLLPQSGGQMKVESDMSGRVMSFILHADYDFKLIKQLLLEDDDDDEAKVKKNNFTETENKENIAEHAGSAVETGNDVNNKNCSNDEKNASNTVQSLPKNKVGRRKPLIDAVLFELSGLEEPETEFSTALRDLADVAKERDIVACVITREPLGGFSPAEKEQLIKISPYLIYLPMTCAAAETKLMYLFGKGHSPAAVRKIMPRNLRGEATPRAVFEGKL